MDVERSFDHLASWMVERLRIRRPAVYRFVY
jgi:hypothetical protein